MQPVMHHNTITLCKYLREWLLMNPITGKVLCCARTATGPLTAPPTVAMNSRRLIRSLAGDSHASLEGPALGARYNNIKQSVFVQRRRRAQQMMQTIY